MNKVHSTLDFSMFIGHENNRQINMPYVKMLMASIAENNMLEYRPILVDSNMRVLDGQHRLCAAKHLQIPIYYQIKEDASDNDIVTLNINQKTWTMEDWLNFYAHRGNKNYIKMQEFSKEVGKKVSSCFRIFQALQQQKSFRGGLFKYPSDEKIDMIKVAMGTANDIIKEITPFCLSKEDIIQREKFQEGLIILLIAYPTIDIEHLKEKLIRHSDSIRTCANIDTYKYMFKEIYNYRRKITI